MIKKINYDFSSLENAIFNVKTNHNSTALSNLKRELNKFFKGSTCREIIYTKNTDKLFFGMCVIPYISGDDAIKILTNDDKFRVEEYYLEIDSKLFDINLSSAELTSVLLHEVGHLVNDASPAEKTKKAVDIYLSKNHTNLIISKAVQYKELLAFAIKDSMTKFSSLFCKNQEEVLADTFVYSCGYGNELESSLTKIINSTKSINKDVDNKLLVLQWTLRVYRDVKHRRISALHTLNKAKDFTASELQKREIVNFNRNLNEIDDDTLIKEETNLVIKKANNFYKTFKYKGMRGVEDDLYEYSLRVKNVDDEDEALMILRQINMRIAMIDDYIISERLTGSAFDKWSTLKHKYDLVREELSKKTTYREKYYGLFLQTPVIKSRFDV